MKKNHLLKNALLIAFLVWSVVIIKQQFNISQYKQEIKTLSQKRNIAEEKLSQNKENLEEEKKNINSPEYIKKLFTK